MLLPKLSVFFQNKKFLCLLLLIFTLVNVFFATYYVRHGDLNFFTDVARDFLLFQEVDAKKIILIGPRSSTAGIFHGPLWIYLTYPAYLIGQGNPLVVGWYWVFLTIVFLISGFLVARKLFGNLVALVYAFLLSGNMAFHTRSLFNPYGALFLIPVFFYTMVMYWQNGKWWQLALHLFLGALIIQFQMAVGIPFVLLSTVLIAYKIFTTRKYAHFLCFLVLFGALGNFFIFELRHGFNMTRAILNYTRPDVGGEIFNYSSQINNRIERFFDLQLFTNVPGSLVGFVFAFTGLLTFWFWKEKPKFRLVIFLLIFYQIGYIFLTFVNKGVVLEHQYLPTLALTDLLFAILALSKHRKLYFFLLVLVIIFNYQALLGFTDNADRKFFGRDQNSWIALHSMGEAIAADAPKEFGYFVYSPDAFAYQPRYAMIYTFKEFGKEAHEYVKMPVTYVVAAPPPPDRPYIGYQWWRTDRLNIKATPSATFKFPNGFLAEKYYLTAAEQKVSFEPTIDVGIHFR